MARIPELSLEQMSEEQRSIAQEIASGPRGGVRGPLAVWLHSPKLAQPTQKLGAFCRYESTLPPRLSELAIIITAAHWRAGFEWCGHAPLAREGGITEAAIEAIRRGNTPILQHADERAVHQFATELLRTQRVTQPTWDRATAQVGATGVVELIGILGYYGLVSMTINACEIPVQAGNNDPFAA